MNALFKKKTKKTRYLYRLKQEKTQWSILFNQTFDT